MFEATVATYLNTLLGVYINNLNAENLDIELFSGTIKIINLKLKSEALRKLHFPLYIKKGEIGKITLQTSWTSLFLLWARIQSKFVVHIEDVTVYISSDYCNKKSFIEIKEIKKIFNYMNQNFILYFNSSNQINNEKSLKTITDYVQQVFVKSVNVKYEDLANNMSCSLDCDVDLQTLRMSFDTTLEMRFSSNNYNKTSSTKLLIPNQKRKTDNKKDNYVKTDNKEDNYHMHYRKTNRSKKWFIIISAVFISIVLYKTLEVPDLSNKILHDSHSYFDKSNTSIRQFNVELIEKTADLREQLNKAYFYADRLKGFNNKYINQVVNFWNNDYNFTEREAYFNKFPHFKINIHGLDIHFVHVKPNITDSLQVYPLLLLHAWPGSFIEFYKLIPLLTKPREGLNYVFELIIPSLPGYGFSQGLEYVRMKEAEVSIIMKKLMDCLSFDKYIIQGGEWGSTQIVNHLKTFYPNKINGYHTMSYVKNFNGTLKDGLESIYPPLGFTIESDFKLYHFLKQIAYLKEDWGNLHLQAAKQDITESYTLKQFSLTELLDHIMIYWVNDYKALVKFESFDRNNTGLNLDSNILHRLMTFIRFTHGLVSTIVTQIIMIIKELIRIPDHSNNLLHYFLLNILM